MPCVRPCRFLHSTSLCPRRSTVSGVGTLRHRTGGLHTGEAGHLRSHWEPAPQNAVAGVRWAHVSGSRPRCARFSCPKKPSWPSRPPRNMKVARRHEAACPGSTAQTYFHGNRREMAGMVQRCPARTFCGAGSRAPQWPVSRSDAASGSTLAAPNPGRDDLDPQSVGSAVMSSVPGLSAAGDKP